MARVHLKQITWPCARVDWLKNGTATQRKCGTRHFKVTLSRQAGLFLMLFTTLTPSQQLATHPSKNSAFNSQRTYRLSMPARLSTILSISSAIYLTRSAMSYCSSLMKLEASSTCPMMPDMAWAMLFISYSSRSHPSRANLIVKDFENSDYMLFLICITNLSTL